MNLQQAAQRGLLGARAEPAPAPADADIKEALADVTKAFEDFKASNDERLEAMNAGKADVLVDEKVDRINGKITDLEEALNKQMKDAARAGLGSSGADDDAKADAKAAFDFYAAAGKIEAGEEVTAEQIEEHKEYRAKYVDAIRRGGDWQANHSIRAEMSVGSEKEGGLLAPGQMLSTTKRRLFETSDVRAIATVQPTTRSYIEFPLDTNEAQSGGWAAEKQSRTETGTPQVGRQKIDTHEQYAEPHVTQSLLDDAAVDIEAWLGNKIGDILSRTENAAFVTADGSDKPRGFVSYSSTAVKTSDKTRAWGKLQYTPTGDAAGFPDLASGSIGQDADALIDVLAELKPQYRRNARWAMARRTEATIRKLKDNEGRYLADFQRLADGSFGFALLNYEISPLEDMPAFAPNAFPIAFGDFRAGYMIVDRMGIRMLRDPYTSKPFVKFYTTKRVGGDVVDFDAIKLMKVAAN